MMFFTVKHVEYLLNQREKHGKRLMDTLNEETHKKKKFVEKQRFFNGKVMKTVKNTRKNRFLEKKRVA